MQAAIIFGSKSDSQIMKKAADVFKEFGVAYSSHILSAFFLERGIKLVDFKLEFGRTAAGELVLADEISPDTCRFWDAKTGEKPDKDRFRRDMGNVKEAYVEIMNRTSG
ncbi:MAG: AIR carboxylase family protein [Treponema sp.]|nr:AIR carboxylase family protein [Treponema sp.]